MPQIVRQGGSVPRNQVPRVGFHSASSKALQFQVSDASFDTRPAVRKETVVPLTYKGLRLSFRLDCDLLDASAQAQFQIVG
jgi:hypothetical protein